MKSIKKVLGLATVVVIFVFVSCTTTKNMIQSENTNSKEEIVVTEKTSNNKKDIVPKKQEFTKIDFIENLQKTLKNGTLDEALALFDTIPEKYKEDFNLQFIKASLLFSNRNYTEAENLCETLLVIQPENTDVLELSMMIAKVTGDKQKSVDQIQSLLKKDPYNATANISLAEDAVIQKSYQKAKKLYRNALAKDPQNEQALLGYGQTCYYTEDDEVAAETFNDLIEQNPDNDLAFYYLGKLQAAQGKYKLAADNVEKAIEINNSNFDYYLEYGMNLRYLGRYDEAESAWTRAIDLNPTYFLGYVYRAGYYDESNQFEKALDDYHKVIELNPSYFYAYESIGILALHDKKWSEARDAFMVCSSNNKENISYPLLITYCYYMEGDKLNAKKYSDSILRGLDKSSIEYTMLRAYHDETDKFPLQQKISALDNSNRRGKMYFYLGLLYDMFGGTEAAKDYYVKVLNMNSPIFFEYRIAEWNMGKADDGIN